MLKRTTRIISLLSLLALVLVMLPAAASIAAAPPEVNGLFYGDGDHADYIPLGENAGRGTIYYYVENTDADPDPDKLYLAVVVDTSVNDNVFGDTNDLDDSAYLVDAGWSGGGSHHTASALIQSDNVEILLACGAYSAQWNQDYIYDTGSGWASGPGGPDGTPIPIELTPAYYASSLQWNLVNSTWDYDAGGTGPADWTSVNTGDPQLIDEEGWNPHAPLPMTPGDGFNDSYGWEWAMVYEMSLDINVCNGYPIQVEVISAHNSPSKSGPEDVPIPAYDFGDAPDTYSTSLAAGGPHHELLIGGPYLGSIVDPEGDAFPSGSAAGDDTLDSLDDEDGITALDQFTPGTVACVSVIAATAGVLDAWIDFGNHPSVGGAVGVFDAVDKLVFVNPDGSPLIEGDPGYNGMVPAGTHTLCHRHGPGRIGPAGVGDG
jgi:hypothetical protein